MILHGLSPVRLQYVHTCERPKCVEINALDTNAANDK
jgi:hypothetical protein